MWDFRNSVDARQRLPVHIARHLLESFYDARLKNGVDKLSYDRMNHSWLSESHLCAISADVSSVREYLNTYLWDNVSKYYDKYAKTKTGVEDITIMEDAGVVPNPVSRIPLYRIVSYSLTKYRHVPNCSGICRVCKCR